MGRTRVALPRTEKGPMLSGVGAVARRGSRSPYSLLAGPPASRTCAARRWRLAPQGAALSRSHVPDIAGGMSRARGCAAKLPSAAIRSFTVGGGGLPLALVTWGAHGWTAAAPLSRATHWPQAAQAGLRFAHQPTKFKGTVEGSANRGARRRPAPVERPRFPPGPVPAMIRGAVQEASPVEASPHRPPVMAGATAAPVRRAGIAAYSGEARWACP